MRNQSIGLTLILLLLIKSNIFGQKIQTGSIQGSIKSSNGIENMAGFTVRLMSIADSTGKQMVFTDYTGAYIFNNVRYGSYMLRISHIGYTTISYGPLVVAGATDTIKVKDIFISDKKNIQLEDVVVKADVPAFEKQIDRLIINVGSFISNAGTNAVDVLNNSPGVMVEDNGGISLNGKNGIVVLVDGRNIHLSGSDLINYLKSMPSGTLDRIEIMSNPPAKYSALGSAGLIDIKTKKSKDDGFNGNFTIGYAQGRLPKTYNSVNLNHKTDKLNFYGAAGYSLAENFFEVYRDRSYTYPFPKQSFNLRQNNNEKNNSKNFSYKLGVDYDVNKSTSVGVMYSGFSSPYNETGKYLNNFFDKRNILDSVLDAQSSLETHAYNNSLNVSFNHKSDSLKNEINLNFDYLEYKIDSKQLSSGISFLSNGAITDGYTLNSNNPFGTNIYSFQADYSRKVWKNGRLEAGMQYLYSSRKNAGNYVNQIGQLLIPNAGLNNSFIYGENINAAYINLRKTIRQLTLQAGLRIENTNASADKYAQLADTSFNLNYTDVFPTLYFAYKFANENTHILDFSIGRRITRPNYQDLNPSIFFFDRNTSNNGNPSLQPDYTMNYNLNYSFKSTLILGMFYSKTKNKITRIYAQIANAFTLTPINLAKVDVAGLNVNYRHSFFNWWTANLYGELTHSRYQGLILNTENLNNDFTSVQFSSSHKFKISKDWNLELSGLYRGNRILGQGVYKPIGQVNSGVQWKILDGEGSLSLNFRDMLHTWNVRRAMSIPFVDVYSTNINDTQQIGLSFSYKFGGTTSERTRIKAMESESRRAGAN
jgi:hypothetical protein